MTIKKFNLDCAYYVSRFREHLELKNKILNAINETVQVDHLIEQHDDVDISKCDWNFRYQPREWVKIFIPFLEAHLKERAVFMGYSYAKIREIWFQQYNTNSRHGWHVHGSNWTNVYFLDLPDSSPKTQFITPFDQTSINEFEVNEGDILTFPSFVIHKGPPNMSNNVKTIISWNMDTELTPGIYDK